MSQNGPTAGTGQLGASQQLRADGASPAPVVPAAAAGADTANSSAAHYSDLQSAARFPIQLPIVVKSKFGESVTQTQNISANGVLFRVDAEMPIGAPVDFTISLPADVVGAGADVQLDCRGRVVRSYEHEGTLGVGVVIDEYHFERRGPS
jgi:hypothetical protein